LLGSSLALAAEVPLSPIAAEQTWLKLGQYEADGDSPSGWRSAIHSREFFLSPEGRDDPQRELSASLTAFALPLTDNPDQHAQCRFPARWLWLKSRVGDQVAFTAAFNTPVRCPNFDAWTRSGNVESLSIVFATGYLGNPASYYGHTLLKFNFKGGQAKSRLLDVSVNYGAIVEKNDGAIEYIFKSVGGGYDGGFSHIQFYFHNHNYGDSELRDLWEYRLDLPRAAVDLVVAHAWEVLGKRYTYRFFRLNCAYRTAEILEVIDGLKAIPDDWPWIIPQAMIKQLAAARLDGRPLLAEVSYLPSRQSRFYEKYQVLSGTQKSLLKDMIEGNLLFASAGFQQQPAASRQVVLDTLLDYYQFVGNPLDSATRELRQKYAQALAERYRLEVISPDLKAPVPQSPHLGRPLGWLQLGAVHNSVLGDAVTLRLRPAYYDALDTGSGQVRNSALSMADLQITSRRGHSYINSFDMIGVDSVNPALCGLPGDDGSAWRLHVGAEQHRLYCDNCLVARAQGDMGYGRQWSEHIFSAVYLGGVLQNDRNGDGHGFARASADVILKANDRSGLRFGYEQRFPLVRGRSNYGATNLEARWVINSATDFRISYRRDRAELFSAGLGFYW
jgi:hypothetical protein